MREKGNLDSNINKSAFNYLFVKINITKRQSILYFTNSKMWICDTINKNIVENK